MTVEQAELIDLISLDHVSGSCKLSILDHLIWDDDHLVKLQLKINNYLQLIESGEIYILYPAVRGQDFLIDIQCIYAPNAIARAFLERAQNILIDAGYAMHFGPLGSAYADDVPDD
ncbi:DUF6572 domain-containing protein [Herminiimonas arsenitoxidans]|uniref:DUF6572 domain-containing protein n=1 Tax=Herminiimonas arsenitoxidans TaxID=1809410 RepID=UPI0009703424